MRLFRGVPVWRELPAASEASKHPFKKEQKIPKNTLLLRSSLCCKVLDIDVADTVVGLCHGPKRLGKVLG